MGLDTSHDCWHGGYGRFHAWRKVIAEEALGINLDEMEGFGGERSWNEFEGDVIVKLLDHSDCDGVIAYGDCMQLAFRLEGLLPVQESEIAGPFSDYYNKKTRQFIDGLLLANELGEDVEFG